MLTDDVPLSYLCQINNYYFLKNINLTLILADVKSIGYDID
jgi:hypothetical protein